jgi:hypothetical protein
MGICSACVSSFVFYDPGLSMTVLPKQVMKWRDRNLIWMRGKEEQDKTQQTLLLFHTEILVKSLVL